MDKTAHFCRARAHWLGMPLVFGHAWYDQLPWRSCAPNAKQAPHPWLLSHESLTAQLVHLSHDQFSVHLCKNEVIDSHQGSPFWVREVILCGGGVPWVLAQSITNLDSVKDDDYDLTTLGGKPLGEVLFGAKPFHRMQAGYASWLHAQDEQTIWARYARFKRQHKAIDLTEIFLPQVWDALKAKEMKDA